MPKAAANNPATANATLLSFSPVCGKVWEFWLLFLAIPFPIFALAEVARPAVVLAKATALGLIVPDLVVRLAFEDWLDLEAKATALGLIVPDLVVRLAFEDWLDLEVVVDLVLLDLLLSFGKSVRPGHQFHLNLGRRELVGFQSDR